MDFLALLGRVLTSFGGRVLGPSWAVVGASWGHLGASWRNLWDVLWASCGILEYVGGSLDRLGAS